MAKEFSDVNFSQDVLQSNKTVIVDFYTPLCGPCRRLAPTVEKLAEEYKDVLVIGKCDVSENLQTGMSYGITAVPTLIVFKSGEEVTRQRGLVSEDDLRALVEKHK